MEIKSKPRKTSLVTNNANLEHLYTLKNFPVSMGCTNQPRKQDMFADMSFSICKDTGLIQLDNLLPLKIVYQNQHNDGVGKQWQDHYSAFAQFLHQFHPKKVLEIGGANNLIATNFLKENPSARWTIIEPHPLFTPNSKIKLIKKWFNNSFHYSQPIDTVVHSHVLEHTYKPIEFLKNIHKFLKKDGLHIFTLPNMYQQLKNKYTNCLNFEHTTFLAEPMVDFLIQKTGFKIIKKEYFGEHSIFYATRKVNKPIPTTLPQHYQEYKKIFMDFINYHLKIVKQLNNKMESFDGNVYLFGAHIFSQYLIQFGLDKKRIKNILDNSKLKQGKRLYGTSLIVKSPLILKNKKNPAVILKVGSYHDEILTQIKQINPLITIFE